MRAQIDTTLTSIGANLERLRSDGATLDQVVAGAGGLVAALRGGGRVFSIGNGGSLCDAMHFAEELSGNFRLARDPLPATAISDPAHLTCVANDFGFEQVFARYVRGHVRDGDALLAISTSGMSPNIVEAARVARDGGAFVVALTGRTHSSLGSVADVDICTPAGEHSDRVQELHIILIHLLVELVERSLFPENYADEQSASTTA